MMKIKKIQSEKSLYHSTTDGGSIEIRCSINNNTDHIGIYGRFYKSSDGGMENNKLCSQYLGIHIAERILSYIYPNVERMSHNNRGYDFICGKGYKVDVKSVCHIKDINGRWVFPIRKNKIPNFFLCLAFDNREDLNPKHIWLIPGHIINDKTGAGISESTLKRWKQYEQPIDDVMSCCNNLYGCENH